MGKNEGTASTALVLEDRPNASLLLQEAGHAVMPLHPALLGTAAARSIVTDIKGGKFAVVWLELPHHKRSVAAHHRQTFYKELALLATAVAQAPTNGVLVGLNDSAWLEKPLVALPSY